MYRSDKVSSGYQSKKDRPKGGLSFRGNPADLGKASLDWRSAFARFAPKAMPIPKKIGQSIPIGKAFSPTRLLAGEQAGLCVAPLRGSAQR